MQLNFLILSSLGSLVSSAAILSRTTFNIPALSLSLKTLPALPKGVQCNLASTIMPASSPPLPPPSPGLYLYHVALGRGTQVRESSPCISSPSMTNSSQELHLCLPIRHACRLRRRSNPLQRLLRHSLYPSRESQCSRPLLRRIKNCYLPTLHLHTRKPRPLRLSLLLQRHHSRLQPQLTQRSIRRHIRQESDQLACALDRRSGPVWNRAVVEARPRLHESGVDGARERDL